MEFLQQSGSRLQVIPPLLKLVRHQTVSQYLLLPPKSTLGAKMIFETDTKFEMYLHQVLISSQPKYFHSKFEARYPVKTFKLEASQLYHQKDS